MAEKAHNYFIKAGVIGGVPARMRLFNLTKVSTNEARSLPDTPDLLKKLEDNFKIIEKEFGSAASSTQSSSAASPVNGVGKIINTEKALEKLRKQISIFADLTAQRSNFQDNLKSTAKRITECLVDAIEVERASIWMYNKDNSAIDCIDLFVRSAKEHSDGISLKASDFPNYFKTISSQRTLAAFNAHTDPGTAEFSEVYLKPLGINSMLDVPIWSNGKMVGVVCNEHTGAFRQWTPDEETFAYLMGNIVAMAVENKKVLI